MAPAQGVVGRDPELKRANKHDSSRHWGELEAELAGSNLTSGDNAPHTSEGPLAGYRFRALCLRACVTGRNLCPHSIASARSTPSSMNTQKGVRTSIATSEAPDSAVHGTPEETSLTVKKLKDLWVVENGLGESVADAPDCDGAVQKARELVKAQGASGISVLGDDGAVKSVDI